MSNFSFMASGLLIKMDVLLNMIVLLVHLDFSSKRFFFLCDLYFIVKSLLHWNLLLHLVTDEENQREQEDAKIIFL